MKTLRNSKLNRGSAFITTFMLMSLLAVGAATYVGRATQSIREARRQALDVQTGHLCEAGVQSVLRSLWRPFKANQNFTNLTSVCSGAGEGSPAGSMAGEIPGIGKYAAGVIGYEQPDGDSYRRTVIVRAVGWMDYNGNNATDEGEPQKVVDVIANFQLSRSEVFDYTYFVNNYGWMDGFSATDLIVNGDMRANGDFNFLNGSPTINGSVYAANNDKLTPRAAGLVNTPPIKWTNSTYATNSAPGTADNEARWRQAYNSAVHGARGSSTYDQWRDLIFDSDGGIVNGRTSGSVIADSTGYRSWQRTSSGATATTNVLDRNPTKEVIMPDLSDLSYYQAISSSYVDNRASFSDGTANPDFGQGAYVEVWNSTTSSYQRISTNGTVSGSAVLVGTDSKPIKIHGPVTFSQDCVIKGTVEGQGTIYTGRNVHIVGSIRYKNKPDFRGSSLTAIEQLNEKKDMLALAARGSVIMGDTTKFTDTYPLKYMTPPFTKARYDDLGNLIPAFNAKETDATGFKKYQSVIGDTAMKAIAEGINQIDAVLYTNFVGGGNIGTAGGGVRFNGSIISKDEAMVVYSLPMRNNYDNRIRERQLTNSPLIDLQLPRSPVMLRSAWQDRGFSFAQ